jgi:hypothetical protein
MISRRRNELAYYGRPTADQQSRSPELPHGPRPADVLPTAELPSLSIKTAPPAPRRARPACRSAPASRPGTLIPTRNQTYDGRWPMHLEWGTVPAFLSLAVSAWALVESRQAKRAQHTADLQGQALQVLVSPLRSVDSPPNNVTIHLAVENFSEYPVTDVWLMTTSQLVAPDAHVVGFVARLEPKQRLEVVETVRARPDPYPLSLDDRLRVNASFVDRNGYKWQRWGTGEVKTPINLRARNPVVARLWRLVPKPLIHRWLRRRSRPAVRQRIPPT